VVRENRLVDLSGNCLLGKFFIAEIDQILGYLYPSYELISTKSELSYILGDFSKTHQVNTFITAILMTNSHTLIARALNEAILLVENC
jgi:hypothetical protein